MEDTCYLEISTKEQLIANGSSFQALVNILSPNTGSNDIFSFCENLYNLTYLEMEALQKNAIADKANWIKIFAAFEVEAAADNLNLLLSTILNHVEEEEAEEQLQPPLPLPAPILSDSEQSELNILSVFLSIMQTGENINFNDYGKVLPRSSALVGVISLNKIAAYLGLENIGTNDELSANIAVFLGVMYL